MRPEEESTVSMIHPRFGALRRTFLAPGDVPALATLENGTYRVEIPGGHVHFFVQADPSDPAGGEAVFVFFHGAVGGRSTLAPPFFSGLGIQKKIGSGPLVAFSDPVVESDPACALGWFAGSATTDVAHWSAEIVHQLLGSDPRNTWLVGGSGGGYAALNIGHRLGREASVLAWNPQTIVANYSAGPVRKYLQAAFPLLAPDLRQMPLAKVCRKASRVYGRDLELGPVIVRGSTPRQVLVLQNYDDWHVRPHAVPLVRWLGLHQRSAGRFDDGNNAVAWFPEMGHGHVGPDTDRLAALLRLVSAGRHPLARLIRRLDDADFFPSTDRSARPMDLRLDADMLLDSLRVRTSTSGAQVLSDLVREGRHGLTYRFAQHRQSIEIASGAWTTAMEWFPVPSPDLRTGDTVDVAVRDGFGHVLGSVRADW